MINYCAYPLQIEHYKRFNDDTALNEIKLNCDGYGWYWGRPITITSEKKGLESWGEWTSMTNCAQKDEYLTAFSLQVEESQVSMIMQSKSNQKVLRNADIFFLESINQ